MAITIPYRRPKPKTYNLGKPVGYGAMVFPPKRGSKPKGIK